MKNWKIGLIVVAILIAMVAPTVALARGFWCVGDPVIAINDVEMDIVIQIEVQAVDVMRSEGKSVLVMVAIPRDFDYHRVRLDETIPTKVRLKDTGADDVRVSVKAPNLRGYGEYAMQVTVNIDSQAWSQSSGEVTRQTPKVKLRVPGDLF